RQQILIRSRREQFLVDNRCIWHSKPNWRCIFSERARIGTSPYSWLVIPVACVFFVTLAVALVAILTLGSSPSHDYDDDLLDDGGGQESSGRSLIYGRTTTTERTS
ncbi:hypothetical protein MTO96_037981, partial [Rhipicephalus appendiculatus]